MTALILAALVTITFSPPTPEADLPLWVGTEFEADSETSQIVTGQFWQAELAPGQHIVRWRALYADGVPSDWHSIGFSVPPPPDQRTITVGGILQAAPSPDGPWVDVSSFALTQPWTAPGVFFRTKATLTTNAPPVHAGPPPMP